MPSDQLLSGTMAGRKLKLCLVHYVDSPNSEDCEKGIRKALEDKNLREGVNFTFDVFNSHGDISVLNSIAGTIGNETWDLIFTSSTPSVQIMAKKLPHAKIVFTNVGDPIAAGLGKSFDDHLPNLCGISTMSDFERLISHRDGTGDSIRPGNCDTGLHSGVALVRLEYCRFSEHPQERWF